jgi:peptidoglycan/LPS O-acetylase OafA/YrhL
MTALAAHRALAALFVVTTHVAFATGWVQADAVGHLMSRLDWGVTIFFLLSGFLLYRPWARAALEASAPPRVLPYLWRRGLRILPAYWLLVVVVLLLLPQAEGPHPVRTWLSYLGLLQTYSPDRLVEGLTHTWSLGAEVAFYLALPVIAWAVTRRWRGDADRSARVQLVGLALVAAAGLATTVVRGSQLWPDPRLGLWLPSFLDWFALGMAAAVIHERRRLGEPGPRMRRLLTLADDTVPCLVVAASLLVAASTPLAGPYALEPAPAWSVVVRHVLYGVAAALFLAPGMLGVRRDLWHRALDSRPVQALGRWSYGIFLWHLAVMWTLIGITGLPLFRGGAWWLLPTTVAVTVVVAAVSWRLVEKPASRLRSLVV